MFKRSYKKDVVRLLGEDALSGSSLTSREGETVHFLVTEKKMENFVRHCNRIESVLDPVKTINEYTDHTTEHYARINLALAADTDGLAKFSDYIPQLRAAIYSKPLFDDGRVYRGVDLSPLEVSEMERLQRFFIPSFTSTSIDSKRAYKKDTMMVINLPYACRNACSITESLSRFHNEEREVLLACYSAFRLERVEQDGTTKVLSLYLDEHLSSLDTLAHNGEW
uniref:ADP ribosyltransferase domain-containing protein n=1 Tax=Vannella robusta TaxID=1487602 RepID=A0A7S4IPC5_9EUKA|mmetsp:Transcript_6240/g.7703  ORF Transcript_6240/g.7703 Transcript_6240/m.7703 type:complete len:224 (+) Transcript_6240:24-695(+)